MKKFERFLRAIDLINGWTGRIVGHLLILMMFIVTFEVLMRYIFNAPTLWAMELNQYLFLILIALGGGHVLLNKGHINVDILYGRFDNRTRAIIDLFTFPIFFLFIIILIWQSLVIVTDPLQFKETSEMANIPVYPVRLILVVGAILIALQGLTKFARDLTIVIFNQTSTRPGKEETLKRGENKI